MKIPPLLQNIYRDLRDRRLLSIAIALVAAIIAVPFLMGGGGGGGSSAPAPALTAAPFNGDEQLDPVVLAEAPGLRDFHERLAAFNSHNPFKVKAPERERQGSNGGGGGTSTGDDAGGTSADVPATGSTDTPTTDTPTTDTPTTDTGTSTSPGASTGTGTGSNGGSGGGGGGSSSAPQLLTYRVDVRVGPVGHTKTITDVPQLTFLPDRKHPLLQYIDADATGSEVAFIVNPDAFVLDGDGRCVRDRKHCQYMLMEPKDEMYFLFEDRQYRVQLLGIVAHRQPLEPQGNSDGGGSAGRDPSALPGG